jgi:hypothetical protein
MIGIGKNKSKRRRIMKHLNLIKLLSVLVCLLVVLVACGEKSEPNDTTTDADTVQQTEELTTTAEEETTQAESETETRGPVDPVLENYFAFPMLTPPVELQEAVEVEGECVDRTANNELIVIRQAELGFDNKVKETFTVYNTVLGTTVLTVDNVYSYGTYDSFNWNNKYDVNGKNYPESDMEVEIVESYDYLYIAVKKAEFTKIDEEVREENPDGLDYKVNTSYVYYDAAGKEFARSQSMSPTYDYIYNGENSYSLTVGDTLAIFDSTTHELISVTDSMKNKVVGGFDVEIGGRGYVLDATVNGVLGYSESFLEIYDLESGACTLRYHYETSNHSAFVLNNGNVLISYASIVDEDSVNMTPDIVIMGMQMAVDNYVLDVSTGKVEQTDFNYLPYILINRDTYLQMDNDGIEITENVDNVFIGFELGQRVTEMSDMHLMALNNDLTVAFIVETLVPEQNPAYLIGAGGIITLDNGDYLVMLDSAATGKAIVTKNGRIRSYLGADAQVVGDFVVTPDGVYDYDMNEKFLFETEMAEYSFVTAIRDNIILSKTSTYIDELYDTTKEVTEYYVLDCYKNEFTATLIFEEQSIVEDQTTNDYIVTVNKETGKYTLYNINLEHVLTTSSYMNIYEIDGKYTVHTTRKTDNGMVDVLYTLE